MSSRWDASPQPDNSSSSSSAGAAAAAAAAAAAKIAAQFGTGSKQSPPAADGSGRASSAGAFLEKKRESNEAEFNEYVDVNDVKNRYLITRGSTQQQISDETGASLTTKGRWYPDRNMAQPDEPPLYVHVAATTKDILDKALERVHEVINSEAPQLIEERGMRGKAPTPTDRPDHGGQRPFGERRKWTEVRIDINLEPMRNFNTRAKIVGPGGMFVKYIQAETGTRVQIKGRGSGFRETDTGAESMENLHVHITGPDDNMIQEAKVLSEDLIDAVRTEWEKSRAVLEQQGFAVPPPGGWPQTQGASNAGYPNANGNGYGQPQGGQAQWARSGSVGGGGGGGGGGGAGSPQAGYQQQQQQPYGQSQQQQQQPAAAAKDPHQEALDKYWKDYITWEDSFKAYHGKMPTKEDGGQDVPPQYRHSS